MNHSDSHWFQFTLLERSVCQDSNNKIVLHKNDIRIVFNLNRGPNRFSGMLELTLLLLGFGNYRFYVSIFYFYWVKLWIMIFFWCENVKKLLSALNTFVLPLSVSENLVSFSFLDHKNYIFFSLVEQHFKCCVMIHFKVGVERVTKNWEVTVKGRPLNNLVICHLTIPTGANRNQRRIWQCYLCMWLWNWCYEDDNLNE